MTRPGQDSPQLQAQHNCDIMEAIVTQETSLLELQCDLFLGNMYFILSGEWKEAKKEKKIHRLKSTEAHRIQGHDIEKH